MSLITAPLAKKITAITYEMLPDAALKQARKLVLDGLAVAVAGALSKGDWKSALAMDPNNREGLTLKATATAMAAAEKDGKCPECGSRLRTKLAKQCLECGADWHRR